MRERVDLNRVRANAQAAASVISFLMTGALVVSCSDQGATGQVSPSPSPAASISVQGWDGRGTLAVYDGLSDSDSGRHKIWVVGFTRAGGANTTARVLATATFATRSRLAYKVVCPVPCAGATDPPYVSTSKSRVYVLDGDTTVRRLEPDGSLTKVTSIPGTPTARAAFAVSPDDAQIAVGVIDFATGTSKVYVEKLGGGGRVDVFTGAGPLFYWPIRWRSGRIVLATGTNTGTFLNPYNASGYALIDPAAGAKPVALGAGDCVPSGTLTSGGTACVVRPGTPCLEDLVANAVSPYYYNSCLRRVDWSGKETTFLLPNDGYTSTFTVSYAALSPTGHEITTDNLGRLEEPVSPTHGGNNFLGPSTSAFRPPARPCMGWIDGTLFSFTYVNPDGSSDARIIGVTFEGVPDIAPGLPGSPVNGDLVGTFPDALAG